MCIRDSSKTVVKFLPASLKTLLVATKFKVPANFNLSELKLEQTTNSPFSLINAIIGLFAAPVGAVSYTHLDVYKRQVKFYASLWLLK